MFATIHLEWTLEHLIRVLFFSRPLPKAGRELQTELNTRMMKNDGPLAKNQPEASVIAVSEL